MAAFNKFNSFTLALGSKKFDLANDALKAILTNTVPVATMAVKGDLLGEVANGNGYTTGGVALVTTSFLQAAGVAKLILADKVITAAGGQIGPFRYVVIYDDTAANDDLIGWFDRGNAVTLDDTEFVTLDLDQAGGAITIT